MKKFQEDIEKMKKIHNHILNRIDKENDQEELFQNIKTEIQDQDISKNSHLFKTFLYMLSKILSNHYRYPIFFSKFKKIIPNFKTEIKQFFQAKKYTKYSKKVQNFYYFFSKKK